MSHGLARHSMSTSHAASHAMHLTMRLRGRTLSDAHMDSRAAVFVGLADLYAYPGVLLIRHLLMSSTLTNPRPAARIRSLGRRGHIIIKLNIQMRATPVT